MSREYYAQRWRDMSYGTEDGAMMRLEADEAESYGERPCSEPGCGRMDAFYRPAVGWWCDGDETEVRGHPA